jgi:hypothetical protein
MLRHDCRSIRQILQVVAVFSPLKLVHPIKICRGGKDITNRDLDDSIRAAMSNGGVAAVRVLHVPEIRTHLKNRE